MIKLDEQFYLEKDNYSWSLIRKINKGINEKTGKETISTDTWWYPTIQGCLGKYANEATKKAETLEELKEKLSEVVDVIKSLKI